MEEAIHRVEKSQREVEAMIDKIEAEQHAENLEEDEVQSLSKAIGEIELPFHRVRILSPAEMKEEGS